MMQFELNFKPEAYLPILCNGWDGLPLPTATPIPARRGIEVFNSGDETTLHADWYYTWYFTATNPITIEFVPMFRPSTLQYAANYSQTYAYKNVLAFNEPDAGVPPDSDGVGTADDLAILWRQLEIALPNSLLIGPGLTNHCYSESCWSLSDFLNAYHNRYGIYPRLDGLAIHYYQYFSYDVNIPDNILTQPYRRTWNAWINYMKQTLLQ